MNREFAEFLVTNTKEWVAECVAEAHAKGLYAPTDEEREQREFVAATMLIGDYTPAHVRNEDGTYAKKNGRYLWTTRHEMAVETLERLNYTMP